MKVSSRNNISKTLQSREGKTGSLGKVGNGVKFAFKSNKHKSNNCVKEHFLKHDLVSLSKHNFLAGITCLCKKYGY